jgi:hypothetical protein
MRRSASPPALGFPLTSAIVAMPPDTDPTVERLQRWVTGVNSFLGHAQDFLVHAFLPTVKLAVLAAILFVVAKVAGPHLRRRLRPVKWAGLRIVPDAETRYDPTAWLPFYRALYGMASPAWQPKLTSRMHCQRVRNSTRSEPAGASRQESSYLHIVRRG